MPRKISRETRKRTSAQLSRPNRRRGVHNPKTAEYDESSFSASAKKFKAQDEILVTRDTSIEYQIINFITVFAAISEYVQCKLCNGPVKFQTASQRGLGFKIVILCDKCDPRSVNSCGSKIVEIAAYLAAGIFNAGKTSLLYFMNALGLSLGPNAHAYVGKEDAERISISNARAQGSTREGRMSRRQQQLAVLEANDEAEGSSYGPGIDDSISDNLDQRYLPHRQTPFCGGPLGDLLQEQGNPIFL